MEKRVTPEAKDKHSKTSKKPSLKSKLQKSRSKFLNSYYGNPIRDMKLICITGSTGKSVTAHFLHEILRTAGEHVAILASDNEFNASMLHKFFADAWKAGANYVIVTAPTESLKNNVFYNLPIHAAALTNFVDSSLTSPTPEEFLESGSTLFEMSPKITILNSDDIYYSDFSKYSGTEKTLTYGHSPSTNLRINSSTLYKKGVEAVFSIGSSVFTVASFLTGEPVVSYMACAATIATALGLDNETISEGLANYNPENL